jgi:hypothetical protein
MPDMNFNWLSISNKVSIPIIGSVDAITAILAGGIAFIILVVIVYKALHRKKNSSVPPEHGQQGQNPQPWKGNAVPRRLRRRGEETEALSPEQPVSVATRIASKEKSLEIANQLKGSSAFPANKQATASASRRHSASTAPREDELESLAEDLAGQNEREEKAKQELEELRKKLGILPTTETENQNPSAQGFAQPVPSEEASERRHQRWRDRVPPGKKPEPQQHGRRERGKTAVPQSFQQPSESENQLEELKKMEFKDLLKESESGEEKEGEEELKELENGEMGGESLPEEEEGPTKCPNCKRMTEKILYCPECGTGFCKQCATSFKKQGTEEYYQCTQCGAYVKSGRE